MILEGMELVSQVTHKYVCIYWYYLWGFHVCVHLFLSFFFFISAAYFWGFLVLFVDLFCNLYCFIVLDISGGLFELFLLIYLLF